MVGDAFQHRVFSRGHPGRGTLHVYIEGDGRAWLDSTTINSDPTPRKPLMLELMALDPQPSVYVGRPCYFGLADSPGCSDREWTSNRYSSAVVASLQRVIETLVAEGDYEHVVLFGHSGGGTLATLLATRLAHVDALVTIAPNLDVAGWSALHGYSPLTGSLDPARTDDFPDGILQVHWLGSNDDEVPPRLIEALEPRLGQAQVRVREGFDHGCCWNQIWPEQLKELEFYFGDTAAHDGEAAAITTINGREIVRLEENLQ